MSGCFLLLYRFNSSCLLIQFRVSYLEPSRTSMMEVFCNNSQQLKDIKYFCKNYSWYSYVTWVINRPLIFNFVLPGSPSFLESPNLQDRVTWYTNRIWKRCWKFTWEKKGLREIYSSGVLTKLLLVWGKAPFNFYLIGLWNNRSTIVVS